MNPTKMMAAARRVAAVLLLAFPLATFAAEQKTFATPEAAVDALMAALKADDDAAIVALFGDEYKDLVISPDRAANSATRAKIVAAMQTMRVLDERGADKRVVLIGDQAWPMPIPLVKDKGAWRFATAEGADELVNRRIGGNERNAIYVLRAYLDAQRQYASKDRDGDNVLQYAQKLGSSPGKHDGLYWPADAAKGEEASPFGPLVAESAAYLKGHKEGDPYRGYRFKILTRQGKSRAGRRVQLRDQRPHDRRLRDGRVSGAVRRQRHHDVHREQQRQGLREGPRPEFREDRRRDDDLRSGSRVEGIAGLGSGEVPAAPR